MKHILEFKTHDKIKIGSSGEDVKIIQAKLGIPVDGKFDAKTEAKVKEWQKANGIKNVDGIVGAETWKKMFGVTEGFWNEIFGRPKATGDISKGTVLRGQGWTQTGKDTPTKDTEDYYIVFQGQKFYDDDVEYDDVYSTKPLPRIERGKLIIANPAWKL